MESSPHSPPAHGQARSGSGSRRPVRVLMVEDSPEDTLLLARAFRQNGFEPDYRCIASPATLAEALDASEWDLILTDYNVAGLSPDDVLRALRERGLDVPVILVSAYPADTRAVAAMRAGIDDYVLKDNLSRLGPAVERELRAADDRRSHRLVAAELERVAARDALTGLANRQHIEAELARVCGHAGNVGHAFLYIDVDQFRVVNENCGHDAGDELIRNLASLLTGTIRGSPAVGRIGPDEFGVLLEHCPISRAWRVAEQIRRAVNAYRFAWAGQSFRVGVSIGVVAIEDACSSGTDILRRADQACRAAKESGRNGIRLYTEEDTALVQRRGAIQWVGRLQQALEQDDLVLFAQPIAAARAPHAPVHTELLVRMAESEGRLIEPGLFIPAAEQFELMPLLDRWVIDRALAYIGRQDSGLGGRWFINLSGTSLSDEGLQEYVGECLFEYGVAGKRLCFEITETAAIANVNAAIHFMSSVRELGCRIALDDFGSGLSSFSYLKSLPADYLKIDGSFIRGMLDDPLDHTIVEAIAHIGHAADQKVIGESVENAGMIEALLALGVDYVQGHAIAAPRRLDP